MKRVLSIGPYRIPTIDIFSVLTNILTIISINIDIDIDRNIDSMSTIKHRLLRMCAQHTHTSRKMFRRE